MDDFIEQCEILCESSNSLNRVEKLDVVAIKKDSNNSNKENNKKSTTNTKKTQQPIFKANKTNIINDKDEYE